MGEDTPQYVKIQNYILDAINSGKYLPGSKIPTEKELAEMFSVSRITANKALKELSVAGVLERVRGSGTFVCDQKTIPTESCAFVSAVKFNPTHIRHHQLISFRIAPGPEALLKKTNLPANTDFYEIILANKKSGSLMESLDYIYIPSPTVPDTCILQTLDYLCTHFVFDYLKTKLDTNPKYMKIFVNTPLYPFLESARELLNNPPNMQMWCTDIYDADMQLLGSIYTIYPDTLHEVPLFTFAL
ncbi:MAG: GntR family transcriptional regulator [Clostridiales bacterium]